MSVNGPWHLLRLSRVDSDTAVALDLGRLHVVTVSWGPGGTATTIENPRVGYRRAAYLERHRDDRRIFQSYGGRTTIRPSLHWKRQEARAILLAPFTVTLALVTAVLFVLPPGRQVLRRWASTLVRWWRTGSRHAPPPGFDVGQGQIR